MGSLGAVISAENTEFHNTLKCNHFVLRKFGVYMKSIMFCQVVDCWLFY